MADWVVEVIVPAGDKGIADFAVRGIAEICVSNVASDVAALGFAWEGQDELMGSIDDVDFNWSLSELDPCIENIPTGQYDVNVLGQSGTQIRSLSITAKSGTTRLNTATGQISRLSIPATGRDQSNSETVAVIAIFLGLGMLVIARQRKLI